MFNGFQTGNRTRQAEAHERAPAEVHDEKRDLARAERVERFRWAPPGDGFFRVPAGPGWALVGDAGYHLDPITAQGISDAFRDAGVGDPTAYTTPPPR